jgi:hypothetical protein
VRVFSGATMNGWDHGPLRESARNATTSSFLGKVRVLATKSSFCLRKLTIRPVTSLVAHQRVIAVVRLDNCGRFKVKFVAMGC